MLHGVGITRLFSYHVKRELTEAKLVRVLPTGERDVVPVIHRRGACRVTWLPRTLNIHSYIGKRTT